MAGHIQDRWWKTEKGPDGKPRKVKTERYGKGMRYRARYTGPDGQETNESFPDRQKRKAEEWLTRTAADMSTGQYRDPRAAKITFQQYAQNWLAGHTTQITSQDSAERQLRLHVFPYIGRRSVGAFLPGHIRTWLAQLAEAVPSASYRLIIYGTVSSLFNAAVDDGLLPKNPCRAKSVRPPKPEPSRVVPWTIAQIFDVKASLGPRFRSMVDVGGGCGLRQGEIFGLPVDALDFENGWLTVKQQLKRVRGKFVFALPKRDKVRDVPLPDAVAAALRAHMNEFAPVEITLPWRTPTGPLVTKRLIFVSDTNDFIRSSHFDDHRWKPALAAAGLIPQPDPGQRYASAREHGMHAMRHFYASVLLDEGESIRALSQYLGHSDPGFTLRTYTHLMPSSESRTRRAVDKVYEASAGRPDGPETAQAA